MALGYEARTDSAPYEAAEEPHQYALIEQLAKLGDVVDRLEGERNLLYGRLEPILTPPSEPKGPANPSLVETRPPYSDITCRIMEITRRVDAVGSDLVDWRRRVEVG